MVGFIISGQESVYVWARFHRIHHKWSDTDGDHINTKRGFFFAHCGWLMTKEHPDFLERVDSLDFSDLLDDPLVRFQKE